MSIPPGSLVVKKVSSEYAARTDPIWMYTRGGRYARKAVGGAVAGYSPKALWYFVRRTGGAPSTTGADPIGHMLHLH